MTKVLLGYVFVHRHKTGAWYSLGILCLMLLWSITQGLEFSVQDLRDKLIFAKLQSTVSAWIEWNNTVPGSVFLSKGSKQFRFVPFPSGLYKIRSKNFYDEVKSEPGNFYANAYADPASLPLLPAGKKAKPQQAAVSKCIFWTFIDFNRRYGNVNLENADDGKSDFSNSGGKH